MAKMIRLRINTPLRGHAAGIEVDVPAKDDGSPADLFWRRRLRDAGRAGNGDGCVTVVRAADETAAGAAIMPAGTQAALAGGGER